MTLKSLCFALLLFASCSVIAAELGQLNPDQLQSLQQQKNPLIVDVRTPSEWQASGIIPNSHKLQGFDSNGQFDAAQWLADLEKLKTSPDQPVVLVCRSGNRSSKIGAILTEQGQNNIYHLNTGIQGWIQSGKPVQAQ